MKILSVLAVLWAGFTFIAGAQQKKSLTNDINKHWSRLSLNAISDDGNFIYFIKTNPDSLIIRSTNSAWQKKLPLANRSQIQFSADSKSLIFKMDDKICQLNLEDQKENILRLGIQSFKLSKGGQQQWLAMQLVGKSDSLILRNMQTCEEISYAHASEYRFNKLANYLFINDRSSISRIDLQSGKEESLIKENTVQNLVFDDDIQRFAFYSDSNHLGKIFYFGPGLPKPRVLTDDQIISRFNNAAIISPDDLHFSASGQTVFFQLKKLNKITKYNTEVSLKVWSYRDKRVLTHAPMQNSNVWFAQNVRDNAPVLIFENHSPWLLKSDNFALVWNDVYEEDQFWDGQKRAYSLINIHSGEQKIIHNCTYPGITPPLISPNEKFVVWFDNKDHFYHSYNVTTQQDVIISNNLIEQLYDKVNDVPARRHYYGIAGWQMDGSILVYGEYDIWKLDPTGKTNPICVTKFYGREHHTILRRVVDDNWKASNASIADQSLLLTGFDVKTKKNGFYQLSILTGQFKVGEQGNYLYTFNFVVPNALDPLCEGSIPKKAVNASQWLVTRMSATQSPNLFLTNDFKHFKQMSEINPERNYNWLTSELIRWSLPDGKSAEGLLYKPENFDSLKKYPVIFHYYEKMSDLLNWFPANGLGELTADIGENGGIISIANYVSKGYLVFVPNIYYRTGAIAESITTSVGSAVQELKKRSYVDNQHIGLQGHSFGGFETVTLLTKLDLFAAAQSSNGLYNSTAYYNHVFEGGGPYRNSYFDLDQGNLGCTPWECPEIYVDNSPIFHVQNIHTPLLLLHNKGDTNVPITQSIDLYVSMRRMQKPVWLLDYGTGQAHNLEGLSSVDFAIRQEAFFDYFLKGGPLPDWMASAEYNVSQLLN